MDETPLPEILEIKESLAGARKQFRCRLLERTAGSAVVLFVSRVVYTVADLALPPGTITFGHFWTDRPYNVYHWLTPGGATLAHYFNLADGTALDGETLRWRDLTVDLLVRPDRAVEILDEDELPPGLDPTTRALVEAARRRALDDLPALLPALEARAGELWPRALGGPRP
jgi:hypothetical protein